MAQWDKIENVAELQKQAGEVLDSFETEEVKRSKEED